MKAAVFHAAHEQLTIEDIDRDDPRPQEVVVRTAASGVCHSDVHFYDGLYVMPTPAVLGHEAAGVVEAVGSQVTEFVPGDRVIACLSIFCGTCERCLSGEPFLCSRRPVRGPGDEPALSWKGGRVQQFAGLATYAEEMLVHQNALVKIEKEIEFDRAALIGCGVTTGLGAVLNTAAIDRARLDGRRVPRRGRRRAVRDPGRAHRRRAHHHRRRHPRVEARDMPAYIASWARRTPSTPPRAEGTTRCRRSRASCPVGVDYSFEAIGLKSAMRRRSPAYESIRRGGTATIIGMMRAGGTASVPQGQKVEIDGPSLLGGKKLQGSSMGSNRFRIDMPAYIDWYLQGKLLLDEMITRRGALEDVNEAFRAMKAGEVARTVLMFVTTRRRYFGRTARPALEGLALGRAAAPARAVTRPPASICATLAPGPRPHADRPAKTPAKLRSRPIGGPDRASA